MLIECAHPAASLLCQLVERPLSQFAMLVRGYHLLNANGPITSTNRLRFRRLRWNQWCWCPPKREAARLSNRRFLEVSVLLSIGKRFVVPASCMGKVKRFDNLFHRVGVVI